MFLRDLCFRIQKFNKRIFGEFTIKYFLNNLIIIGIVIVSGSAILASDFDDYANRVSMNCIGEDYIIQFSVEGDIITISGEDEPIIVLVDGDTIKKIGKKQRYLVNLGFTRYFIDFDNSKVVANLFGIKMDLECY